MAKRIHDISDSSNNQPIDLSKGRHKRKKSQAESQPQHNLHKQTPVTSVNDLTPPEKHNYLYVRGQEFTPPPRLGHLLKFTTFAVMVVLLITSVSAYYRGKKLEQEIAASAYEGYGLLVEAGKNATQIELANAFSSFESAINNFSETEDKLWFITDDNSLYANDSSTAQAVNALLESGKHFSEAGTHFLEALEEFNKLPLYFVTRNTNPEGAPSITDALKVGLEKTELAIAAIDQATALVALIDEDQLPLSVRSRAIFAKQKIAEVSDLLNQMSEHFPAILKLLGDRYPHRYLVLLQNNHEIRPTGGFIGSYAIIDLDEGYIEKLETHDVYDIDGSFTEVIEPPEEFKAFTGNWRFRDSNYSPDFAVSASKARWFLQKQGGPSVDTVIAINQGLLRDMLEISGPVQVGNFGALDSENYNLLLSYVIEGKVWGPKDPKHILKVFIPAFKDAILKEENISPVTSKLYRAIQQKHIMFYSADDDVQALFDTLGISGRMHDIQEKEDYLNVVKIAVGGTKSEWLMEENILHDTYIDKSGRLTNTLTVKRSHKWTDDIYFEWKSILANYGFSEMPDQIIDILGRGKNDVYLKIFVPEGVELLETNDSKLELKFDEDTKRDYFLTRVANKPGDTTVTQIKYQLPFRLDLGSADTYKLVTEKQPGSVGSIFTKTVNTDPAVENLALHPSEARLDESGQSTYATNLVYDRYFSGIWSK